MVELQRPYNNIELGLENEPSILLSALEEIYFTTNCVVSRGLMIHTHST